MKQYLKELQTNLGEYQIPQILKDLIDFEISMEEVRYIEEGFSFNIDDCLEIMLDNNDVEEENIEKITGKLIEFASADITGGIFTFWLKDDIKNVEDVPIIWFGGEGEMKLIHPIFKILLDF